jgi:hypothetical protein
MTTDIEQAKQDVFELGLYTDLGPWEHSGLKVLSLYELMDYFHSHEFVKVIREVYAYELKLKERVEESGDWNKELPAWEDEQTINLLDAVRAAFNEDDFPSVSKVSTIVYAFATSKCTYQDLYIRIVMLREMMEAELRGRQLILVPGIKAEYCDRKDAFGDQVAKAFPSAENDLVDACNCYALGLNTACVFHLMRVLEKGLRALAKDLSVEHEIENWGRVIERMEIAIAEVEKQKRTRLKLYRQQFYGECAVEFRYFKNAWRNHVMHTASTYSEAEAEKIMEHVKNFMERLSLELTE